VKCHYRHYPKTLPRHHDRCRFRYWSICSIGTLLDVRTAIHVHNLQSILKQLHFRFGDNHLRAVWRLSLGLGVIPAAAVFIWRLRMEEPTRFKKDSMKFVRIPYGLVIKRYWRGLLGVSLSWFIYDFITYVNNRFHALKLVAHRPPDIQYVVALTGYITTNCFCSSDFIHPQSPIRMHLFLFSWHS
jgi:hypothetical protein